MRVSSTTTPCLPPTAGSCCTTLTNRSQIAAAPCFAAAPQKAKPKPSTPSPSQMRNILKAPSCSTPECNSTFAAAVSAAKGPIGAPFFGMPRGEIFIDGVNFHQEFISMGMDTPVTNRMFQVISALSQAARVDKVSAENFVEQGLVQHYAKAASFASAAAAYQSAASQFPPPNAPNSMVEVVISNWT